MMYRCYISDLKYEYKRVKRFIVEFLEISDKFRFLSYLGKNSMNRVFIG